MYFDWWIGQPGLRHQLTTFAAFYYNASLKYGDHVGVINYKDYAMDAKSAVLDIERGQLEISALSTGRPILRSAISRGDISSTTPSSLPSSSFINSSTSSARTGIY